MPIQSICKHCGTTFEWEKIYKQRSIQFCSPLCRNAANSKRQIKRNYLVCDKCGTEFERKASKTSKGMNFCSSLCHLNWKIEQGNILINCEECGKSYKKYKCITQYSHYFCSRKCVTDFRRKERILTSTGYIEIWIDNKRIKEHRYIVEQYLGRPLTKKEIIHHINGVTTDNRIENLQVMSQSEHIRIHRLGTEHTKESRSKLRQSKIEFFADPIRSKKTREAVISSNKRRTKTKK